MVGGTRAASLSVLVVTFNSESALATTLPALVPELAEGDELLVLDNASADATTALVHTLAPRATVIESPVNVGFAAGANRAAEHATGELLLFLNPDAAPAEGFGEAIRRPLELGYGWSAWMGLVTSHGGRTINTSGGVVHFTGIAWAGHAGAAVEGAPSGPREVPFASGACLAVPRAVWRRHGGFSPAFFMYCEDVDLSLRLRLAGERVGLEPAARVDHDYAFAGNPWKWRLLERNRWATVVRTYPAPLLLLLAPALLLTELGVLAAALAGGFAGEKARATVDLARALPRLLAERRVVQRGAAIDAREFARGLTPELSSPYLGRAGRLRPLAAGLRAYWWLVLRLLAR